MVQEYREDSWHLNLAGRNYPLTLGWCLIPLLLVGEVALIRSLLGLNSIWKESFQRRGAIPLLAWLPSLVLLLSLWVYFCILAFSWYFRSIGHHFLGTAELQAFLYLADWRNMLRLASEHEIRTIVLMGVATGLCTFLFYYSRPRLRDGPQAARFLRSALLMLAVPVIALLLLVHSYTPSGRETFVPVLRTKVLPQYALLLDLLMPTSPKAGVIPQRHLIPLEPVDAYLDSLRERPSVNVMLIMIEALRADVLREAIEGIPVMPILQDLAKEGVSFERAIAHSPETDYSQVSLYTGQYPLRSSVRDLHQDPDYPHVLIYDLLSKIGYRSSLITNEWVYTKRISKVPSLDLYLDLEFPLTDIDPDLLPEWFSRGRDPRSVHPARLDLLKVEVLERWLKKTDSRVPFVSGLFFYSSHFPYNLPPKDLISDPIGKEVEGGLSFFGYSPTKARQLRTNYHVTLRYIDFLIGRVIEFLKSQQLLDNTIVVITGDHGELFHEHNEVTHGGRLRPEVLHVPLIFYSPKLLQPTKESGHTVGHIDVAPTIVSLLGLPRLDHHQGIPLLGSGAVPNDELTDRRLFAVTQGVVYEEGVVVWPWLLSRDLRSNEVRVDHFDSEPLGNSPLEPGQRSEMEAVLSKFREAQLGYYSLPNSERRKYQPPTVK